jgi:hypothetical protein
VIEEGKEGVYNKVRFEVHKCLLANFGEPT